MHHQAELRMVEVFRRKALVLVHEYLAVLSFQNISFYVFTAQGYLVLYAFAVVDDF